MQKRRIERGTLREGKRKRTAQRNREGCLDCPLRIRLIFPEAVPPAKSSARHASKTRSISDALCIITHGISRKPQWKRPSFVDGEPAGCVSGDRGHSMGPLPRIEGDLHYAGPSDADFSRGGTRLAPPIGSKKRTWVFLPGISTPFLSFYVFLLWIGGRDPFSRGLSWSFGNEPKMT